MLWLIAVVLVVLWALGFFLASLGDIIHFLLIIAVVVILGNVFKGAFRRSDRSTRT